MKKIIYIFLIMFLVPIFVSAETLTYNVCESGCEYSNLSDVNREIDAISDLSDKDIIININSDMQNYDLWFNSSSIANSITINGNGNKVDRVNINALNANINDLNVTIDIRIYPAKKIKINNSSSRFLGIANWDVDGNIKEEILDLSDILEIDETSKNSIKVFGLLGIFKIENMNFSNNILMPYGPTINIYNSNIGKILNFCESSNVYTNIYNSTFNTLKYVNITSENDAAAWDIGYFFDQENPFSSELNYDIYDMDFTNMGDQFKSITTVYFDKEAKLKPGDKLNLVNYLDYYTEDKEIEYTIEDESIAKIENKELIGLKEGSTKVTVTTDEGHVVYNINLVVEKETIPEKIDKMTIKVPITGSKIKAWVVVVSVILVGVALVCSYIFVKNIKARQTK